MSIESHTVFDLSLLLAQLLIILAAARLVGQAVRPLGQPRVIGEIIAGIALGPSVLGSIFPRQACCFREEGTCK